MKNYYLYLLPLLLIAGCSTFTNNPTAQVRNFETAAPKNHFTEDEFHSQVTVLYRTKKRPQSEEEGSFNIINTSENKTKLAAEMCEEKGMSNPKFLRGVCYKDPDGFYCTQIFQCEANIEAINNWTNPDR